MLNALSDRAAELMKKQITQGVAHDAAVPPH